MGKTIPNFVKLPLHSFTHPMPSASVARSTYRLIVDVPSSTFSIYVITVGFYGFNSCGEFQFVTPEFRQQPTTHGRPANGL